jgi:hypothetical protein
MKEELIETDRCNAMIRTLHTTDQVVATTFASLENLQREKKRGLGTVRGLGGI